MTDTEENTSTLMNLIFNKDAQNDIEPEPTDPSNAYARAYYGRRKTYIPVPGRSLSTQFQCLDK